MTLQHRSAAPKPEDFTPLQEHQEQTPSTFFGKPVLYAQFSGLTLSIPTSKLQTDNAVAKFASTPHEGTEESLVKDVDVWVNSSDLILFQTGPAPTGLSIPYPSIALHATMKHQPTQVEALYMNLSLNDVESVNSDEDIQVLEVTVFPPNYTSNPDTSCIQHIFQAMNTCADLHPDGEASDDGDEDGILDETAPGATGWITADNMDDYVDENGNFRGTVIGGENESLGPGAGTVRPRDDEEHVNGVDGADEETKWRRTG